MPKLDPTYNRCDYFLELKGRQCSMQRRKGQKFCSEHMVYEMSEGKDRVPCPLDPNHSVWKKDIKRHLRKCNARPKQQEVWHEQGLNTMLRGAEPFTSFTDTGNEHEWMTSLEAYMAQMPPLELRVERHEGLDSWFEGKEKTKHVEQQSLLVGHLRAKKMLSRDNFYMEFGCGKGELSRSINACLLHESKYSERDPTTFGFGLIDRGTNRLKADARIGNDCGEDRKPIIKRTKMDIEHLNLDKFLDSVKPEKLVGISKHLCGAATDLTLKLLFNSTYDIGLLVAMCCRHVCDYRQLLPESQRYLAEHGFGNSESFDWLKKVVPWAVSNLAPEKEALGLAARRLIDESRLRAVEKQCPGRALLFMYTNKDVTRENLCLCIDPPLSIH